VELLFLGCVLHDVGLGERGNGDQPFDLDGADLAAGWLGEQGVVPDRVAVVWDAIALHLSFEVASRKRPEIALVTAGAGYDLGPSGHALPAGYANRVHAVLPRLHAAAVLHDAIVGQARWKSRGSSWRARAGVTTTATGPDCHTGALRVVLRTTRTTPEERPC
jgi:hypothetical protein